MSDPHISLGRVSTPLENTPAQAWDANAPIAAPLQLHSPTVLPQWVDYNGHMSESCFLLVFGDSSDVFFRFVGIDESYRDAGGHSLYTVQTQIHHIREASEGDPLRLTLQVLDVDDKRVHIFHSMFNATSGELLATGEQMLVHVDMAAGRAASMPAWLLGHMQAIHAAHAVLPRPAQAGAAIGIRRK
ncbi:4-hydroxybenzoyl-CoA thioesterase [Rhodoferax lacus]|uniref:4-hydroxybenzoyl-CoA thioesterase n=1 Tax=Rhodoferax lacus TaxID=2184758 RepID=A0A3E1RHP6_9BURK|nr:thioesterase family protein [Rhodoferax lacus]RFO98140.1 4-hydroxybenzoyl-CoA thioesterase [Rhodoferax lacus]